MQKEIIIIITDDTIAIVIAVAVAVGFHPLNTLFLVEGVEHIKWMMMMVHQLLPLLSPSLRHRGLLTIEVEIPRRLKAIVVQRCQDRKVVGEEEVVLEEVVWLFQHHPN